MEITIEIPEKKAPFVMELLRSLKFLKIKQPAPNHSFEDFRQQWMKLASDLPQNDPEITAEEMEAEIKAVRKNRNRS
ncbi:hypothetical protein [Dyadobacter arcticus]|uniref:Addiction module component n=1 Tax=Dyadobacter arcticus TaxID=1078754 RepID=A0ABX0UI39_9BACT|nr:hypothetical protein [Dyadobacter arcticus]NIJ50871.1 hypothetical protein [Dyadobacter arcticus]